MNHPLTHLDSSGHARMVDVTDKTPTVRSATATGRVITSPETVALLRDGTVPQGDVLAVASPGSRRPRRPLTCSLSPTSSASTGPSSTWSSPTLASTSPRPSAQRTAPASRWRR